MSDRQEGGARLHQGSKRSEPCMPLISIITATFNAARFLSDTIRSIRAQSYPNIEWIVIDGGSTDATLDFLKAIHDIIDYWFSEQARNVLQQRRAAFAEKYQDIVLRVSCGGLS
jgi:glycosyltransferase involved in cell wall biosynthesis